MPGGERCSWAWGFGRCLGLLSSRNCSLVVVYISLSILLSFLMIVMIQAYFPRQDRSFTTEVVVDVSGGEHGEFALQPCNEVLIASMTGS